MVLLLSEARRMDCAFAQTGMVASSAKRKKRVVLIERSPESRFNLQYIPLLIRGTLEHVAIGLCGDDAKSILHLCKISCPPRKAGATDSRPSGFHNGRASCLAL